jgi:hypothetical protein
MDSSNWDSDSWRGAFRIELRAEAIGLASRGWPVVPGTYPTEGRQWDGPRPVREDWAELLGAHPQRVAQWWTGVPYSVLVATGSVVDAVEVDDDLGRRAAGLLRATGRPAPILAMPNGRWSSSPRRDRNFLRRSPPGLACAGTGPAAGSRCRPPRSSTESCTGGSRQRCGGGNFHPPPRCTGYWPERRPASTR